MERTVTDLYRTHASFVQRVLRRSGVADRDLGDAAQDVFVVVHRQLREFEGRSQPRTWLYRIAWNVASEYRRRAFRRRELLEESSDSEGDVPSPDEILETRRSVCALLDAIDRLDAEKRDALISHELDEQPMIAVAKRLGIPLKTAFSRLYAARRALRSELRKQGWACLPFGSWWDRWSSPFARVLDSGVKPTWGPLSKWLALPSRALSLAALVFVGLVPGAPSIAISPAWADSPLEASPRVAEATGAAPAPLQLSAAVARLTVRGAPRRERARAQLPEPAPQPSTAASATGFQVIRTGQIDFGLGPYGESPLANPPLVEPHRHPRAKLGR